MSVLEIRDLHVTVETDAGTTPILNGVTLTVPASVPGSADDEPATVTISNPRASSSAITPMCA